MNRFDEVTIWVRDLSNMNRPDFELTLPTSEDLNYEFDYLIADVEDDNNVFYTFGLYEYQSLTKLNEIAEALTEVEDITLVLAIHEAHSLDINEILDLNLEDYYIYGNYDLKEYAIEYVEENYSDLDSFILNCIDYEKMAREFSHDSNLNETSHGLLIG
ncbi:antirestriction protein ArdA [Arcobacter sp. YIC-310]|uniref:antirestriction protein ArdA n=1 Tax=Arcobacter sp. YIC-310 TaxID=3376632 RepID=UPI003C15CC5D